MPDVSRNGADAAMSGRARLECADCGLMYTVEMLNLVDAEGDERTDPVSNYCPNCGGDDLGSWAR